MLLDKQASLKVEFMIENIKKTISQSTAKKILGNKANALVFLKNIGTEVDSDEADYVWRQVVLSWDLKGNQGY